MRQFRLILLLFSCSTVLSYSCNKKESTAVRHVMQLTDAPEGFPEIPFPDENPFTQQKWELGKRLFYEKALSVDYSISCGSCHKAEIAFSDNVAKSLGAANLAGRQNAPTLANVAYHPYFTRAGGVATLEKQILVPVQEHDEFNFNIVDIADRLNTMPEYVEMSQEVFGRTPDPYVITRAIATFERTIISGNSAYDKFIHRGDKRGITDEVLRGRNLFFSKRTNCSSCHADFNFTNYSFQNNGLYKDYADIGRKRLTGKEEDLALFMVPTLRNIALTAPYMHDGSFNSLREVIEHYNTGGYNHMNKSEQIRPLNLTGQEKKDLIAFLHSLTDMEFVNNKNLYDENK